ncbi:MAG: hypothetical protein ABI867_07075 [Kofleriaceae bacterium]
MSQRPALRPEALAPYFVFAALVHAAGVASRFDTLAAKLPEVVAPALMLVQFPLILLSGYFESRLDYGTTLKELPLWMRITSKPVKLAFTLGFIYIALIPLQTWDVSIGPLDPTPPKAFPEQQRAMWFAMFTAGMFFPFYLAATGLLVPVLRVMTWPLRQLSPIAAAILALALGCFLGMLVFALSTSSPLGSFIATIKDYFKANPALGIAITLGTTFVPLIIGLVRGKKPD